MIEVRYAGVVVGRSAIIRELDTRGLFLGITEPLPVGTTISLRIGDGAGASEIPAKVETVSESQELARAGMRVRFLDPAAATLFGTPTEADPEPPPEPPPEPRAAPAVPAPVPAASSASFTSGAVVASGGGRSDVSARHGGSGSGSGSGGVDVRADSDAASGAPRRIVVDASTEKESNSAAAAPPPPAGGGAVTGPAPVATPAADTGRIPAPDPSAFGMSGKKGKRNKRR